MKALKCVTDYAKERERESVRCVSVTIAIECVTDYDREREDHVCVF